MTNKIHSTEFQTPSSTPTARRSVVSAGTIRLLTAGAAAAPLWAVVDVFQAATRSGYDMTRHPASMLALGGLGWIQIVNFLLAGVLTLGYAVGMRRLLRGGPAAMWAPILLTVHGFGLLVAGVFPLDPGDGFPPGTLAGTAATFSWQAIVHNIGGSLSFIALIAVCFVLARRFSAIGERSWVIAGRVGGVLSTAGLVWASAGGTAGALTLFLGYVVAWIWVAVSGRRFAQRPVSVS